MPVEEEAQSKRKGTNGQCIVLSRQFTRSSFAIESIRRINPMQGPHFLPFLPLSCENTLPPSPKAPSRAGRLRRGQTRPGPETKAMVIPGVCDSAAHQHGTQHSKRPSPSTPSALLSRLSKSRLCCTELPARKSSGPFLRLSLLGSSPVLCHPIEPVVI